MLPKTFRLKKREEFKQVYKEGKSVVSPYLILYFKKRNEQKQVRIGFSASKKLGGAVDRNRIKRRLREAVKPYLPFVNPEYDLIFIARHKIKGISFEDVEKNMVNLIKRAGILKREE